MRKIVVAPPRPEPRTLSVPRGITVVQEGGAGTPRSRRLVVVLGLKRARAVAALSFARDAEVWALRSPRSLRSLRPRREFSELAIVADEATLLDALTCSDQWDRAGKYVVIEQIEEACDGCPSE